ncbi:MAG: ribosomal protein L7/L12 [Proteobacteria bacterium]|nr:ribosomal protein L7/L12 [Pseudomonadota bacterium]
MSTVRLVDAGPDKVAVIKVVCKATKSTLQQAFDAVQSVPTELTLDEESVEALRELGAVLEAL